MTQLRATRPAPDRSRDSRPRRRARRWWLAIVALAVGIAVITDLTAHSTDGYRQQQLRAYLAAAEADVSQCQYGLRDAVEAFTAWQSGARAATRATAATFTAQAIAACGFANDSVVALTSTQPPRSVASPAVKRVAPQLASWAYLDAFTFLQDLRVVIAHPASASARQHADAGLAALAARRNRVEALIESAERGGHLPPRPTALLQVGDLLPGGGLAGARGSGR